MVDGETEIIDMTCKSWGLLSASCEVSGRVLVAHYVSPGADPEIISICQQCTWSNHDESAVVLYCMYSNHVDRPGNQLLIGNCCGNYCQCHPVSWITVVVQ